jgi:hypothetical protein
MEKRSPGEEDGATTLPGSDERRGDAAAAIAPGAELGRYQVLRRVGEGGMGVVYEARDRELGRTVAIKVLRRPRRAAAVAAPRVRAGATVRRAAPPLDDRRPGERARPAAGSHG